MIEAGDDAEWTVRLTAAERHVTEVALATFIDMQEQIIRRGEQAPWCFDPAYLGYQRGWQQEARRVLALLSEAGE